LFLQPLLLPWELFNWVKYLKVKVKNLMQSS